MGTKEEKDPREMEPSPHKRKSEILAQEWHKEFELKLAEIDIGEVLEYFFVYRFAGIYNHGR